MSTSGPFSISILPLATAGVPAPYRALLLRVEARVVAATDELDALKAELAQLATLAASPASQHSVPPKLLTVRQAADALGVGQSTVHNLIRSGELGSRKLGGSRRIPIADLDAFIARLPVQGIGA